MIKPVVQMGKQDTPVILPYLLGDGEEGNKVN